MPRNKTKTKCKNTKHDIRIKMKDFLGEWDQSSRKQRDVILQRFIEHFTTSIKGTAVYSLDKELGEVTPLFFSRILSSFQMNHKKMDSILNHIECIEIYLKSRNYKQCIERFTDCGGIQLLLEILNNRKKHSVDKRLQNKCLLLIKLLIKSNCYCKEIICMNNGIKVLLNIIMEKETAENHDLLYFLYDLLKQLCIRNDAYTHSIHKVIIEYIQPYDARNHEAVKTLLKILQSTLSFDDDLRITNETRNSLSDHSTNDLHNNHERALFNETNMKRILQLLELQNHQIIHELQNMCNVVFKSSKAQIILSQCLMDLVQNESRIELKAQYIQFIQKLIDRNQDILSTDAKEILNENSLNKMYKLCNVIHAFAI